MVLTGKNNKKRNSTRMDNKGDNVGVCLKNVPIHLNVQGLKNLFKEMVGTVGFIKLHRMPKNNYAFIHFDNLK